MKSKSLSATFLKAFTFTFILAQANPAFSSDMSLGVQNGGAPVSSSSGTGGKIAPASGAPGVDIGGIPGAKEKIRAEISKMLSQNARIPTIAATGGIVDISQIQTTFTKYDTNSEPCISAQANASTVCLEKTSPKLQETLNAVNVIVSGLSAAAVADACSTIGKALNVAKLGLTAYTATCGALRATCEYVCSSASGALTELKAAATAAQMTCIPVTPPNAVGPLAVKYASEKAACEALIAEFQSTKTALLTAIDPELMAENPKSIAGKSKLCTYTYADLLLSAGAGILSTIQSMKGANKCEEDTKASDTPTVPTDLAVKCAMDQYKATEECICYLNPRTTGCANSLEKTNMNGESSFGSSGDVVTPSPKVTSMSGLGDNRPTGLDGGGSGSDGSGGAGVPMGGGGSGIGGGGGGGDGMGRGPNSEGGSGLNTDILSGSGGGGGGGAWGRGGSGTSANGKYRDYLPGGNKDPRSLGGQAPWTKEVTGQGGKSNWEKVRDRYRDNKSTLINN